MNLFNSGFQPDYQSDGPTIDQLAELDGFALLEFGTCWCDHCVAATPAIKDALSGHAIPHIRVEDGKGRRLGRQFNVKLWPTLILLKSGNEVARTVRPTETEEVKALLAAMQLQNATTPG